MARRKTAFNIVDVLIIIALLAGAFGIYTAVKQMTAPKADESVNLCYIIKTEPLGDGLETNIASGDSLFSYDGRYKLGTVTASEIRPATHTGINSESGDAVIGDIEGKYCLYITVDAKASLADYYTVDGFEIYVGKTFGAMTPTLSFECECIGVSVTD